MPPLRERREDIPLLTSHFLDKYNRERGRSIKRISPEAMQLLINYSWPGNVRELENIIERVVVMVEEDTIGVEHLPLVIREEKEKEKVVVPRNREELKRLKKEVRERAVAKIEKILFWRLSEEVTGMQQEQQRMWECSVSFCYFGR